MAMPASARSRAWLARRLESAEGDEQTGTRLWRSVGLPVQCGVWVRKARRASTRGGDGGGASKAWRISSSVQPRAGAAATDQARASARRVAWGWAADAVRSA